MILGIILGSILGLIQPAVLQVVPYFAALVTFPLTLRLPNASTYSQIIFSIIMTSVIITTLGLGGAKKYLLLNLPGGGFVVRFLKPIKL